MTRGWLLFVGFALGSLAWIPARAQVTNPVLFLGEVVAGGTTGNILYVNGSVLGQLATTGSGNVVLATSPTLVTPTLGVALATSLNGNTFTTGTYTLTGSASKTLTFSNTLTLAGTDSTTMTFPTTSATIARTDAANTFTGVQTMTSPALTTPAIATGAVITEAVGTSALVITGATQTASFPAINITQTWNNSGVIFTGIKENITKTAADTSSSLMDLQVGSVSKFAIGTDGEVLTVLKVGKAGSQFSFYAASGSNNPTQLARDSAFGWTSSSGDASGTLDTIIRRDAANTLALRNSTSAQAALIYNTFTSSTSFEALKLDWITTANVAMIYTQKGSGGGTARVLQVNYGGTTTSAISVPITSGVISLGGGMTAAGAITATTADFSGRHYLGTGTAPAVTNTSANSCGTSAATLVGTDTAGKVTVGATAGTSCTVTFTSAYANAPACAVANETTSNLARPTSTTTTVILAGTFAAGDVLAYTCLSY